MFCKNCGTKLKDDAQFCLNCGCKVAAEQEKEIIQLDVTEKVVEEPIEESVCSELEEQPQKKKSKKLWLIPVIVCLLAVVTGGGVFAYAKVQEEKYTKTVEQAREHVKKKEYDKAVEKYNVAIKIVRKKDTAYLELAEVYVEQDDIKNAVETLKKADEKAKGKQVTKRLGELQEIQEVREKEERIENTYETFITEELATEYDNSQASSVSVSDEDSVGDMANVVQSVSIPEEAYGIVSTLKKDMNNDGVPELIVVRIAKEENDAQFYTNFLYVQVYTIKDDEVVALQQPQRTMRYETMRMQESGNLNVFVKEENGENYLCVLNCMRSTAMQEFVYHMYMDIMQIEDEDIVCKKSISVDRNTLYDTTDLSLEDFHKQEFGERKILYQNDEEGAYWYRDLEEPLQKEVEEYVHLKGFAARFASDSFRQQINQFESPLPLPYDRAFSEDSENVTDIFRLRAIESKGEHDQFWEYLDYTTPVNMETFSEEEMKSAYQKIIDEYRVERSKKMDDKWDTACSHINLDGIGLSMRAGSDIMYGLYDIDGNGISELIFCYDDTIIDVHSYDGNSARRVVNENSVAQDDKLHIYKDGTIYINYLSETKYASANFGKMSDIGYSMNLFRSEEDDTGVQELGEEIEINWQGLDVPLAETAQSEINDESETKQGNKSIDYTNVYGSIISEACRQWGEDYNYSVYDINHDGVYELLVEEGTCEADAVRSIYTVADGQAKQLGKVNDFHTSFYADEGNGKENYIIQVSSYMGHETMHHLKIEGQQIVQEEIYSNKEVEDIELYYSNEYLIEKTPLNDVSLLERISGR